MKLIACLSCNDIVSLRPKWRTCFCGRSGGMYTDGKLMASIIGECIPLGIHNASFANAVVGRPRYGFGSEFTAFVIPKICDTVIHDQRQVNSLTKEEMIILISGGTS